MDNHVHFILVPETADGLRAAIAEAHRRYALHVNGREGWTAVRYVERNPVAAGLTAQAQDWRWSSARSHVARRRMTEDPLTDAAALGTHIRNWRAMLRHEVSGTLY